MSRFLEHLPELLAPAGTLEAAYAAVANGADAVYLGAERFNARDDGAQLTLDELERACAVAHAHGARVYLTFNILFKQSELRDALLHLGECVDRGIDAAIMQDIGAMRLVQRVYPVRFLTAVFHDLHRRTHRRGGDVASDARARPRRSPR
jgi:putative protease